MTFQNIFSSMADFRNVVSVLPCSPTNWKAWRIFVAVRKRLINNEPSWLFDCHLCRARNIRTAAAFANLLAPKKGALFNLIYFFGSFWVYYIPHNYVIPQAMPYAISQTHSPFYLHRSETCKTLHLCLLSNSIENRNQTGILGDCIWYLTGLEHQIHLWIITITDLIKVIQYVYFIQAIVLRHSYDFLLVFHVYLYFLIDKYPFLDDLEREVVNLENKDDK